MSHCISNIARQDDGRRANLCDAQQVLAVKDIRIEPVIQQHLRIATTALHPLWSAKDLTQRFRYGRTSG